MTKAETFDKKTLFSKSAKDLNALATKLGLGAELLLKEGAKDKREIVSAIVEKMLTDERAREEGSLGSVSNGLGPEVQNPSMTVTLPQTAAGSIPEWAVELQKEIVELNGKLNAVEDSVEKLVEKIESDLEELGRSAKAEATKELEALKKAVVAVYTKVGMKVHDTLHQADETLHGSISKLSKKG